MTAASLRRRRFVDLSLVLAGRDLRVSYGATAVGLLWAPAAVVVQVLVLGFVFVEVVPLDVDDYPAFLFTGIAAWHLASTAIGGAAEAFTSNRDLVRRPGFPDIVLPVVVVVRCLAAFLIGLPIVLAVLAVSGRLAVTALALPLVLLVTVAFVVGPAVVVATAQVRHRDVHHLVRVALTVLFYATPVFYAEDRVPDRYGWVADLNPFAAVVTLHRQVLYEGVWPDAGRLLVLVAWSAAGISCGALVHRRARSHLADDL